jgi:hypothetical protein
MTPLDLDIADYIRLILILITYYFVITTIEKGFRLYQNYQDSKNSLLEEGKMEIRKMVVLMSPDDRLQIVKDYIEFEKTGILGECVLRKVTDSIEPGSGYFIIRAMDIVHEVTLHITKKLYSLDLED